MKERIILTQLKALIYQATYQKLISILIYVFRTYNPSDYQFFPKCIVYSTTGIECPGCGIQRSAHSLLNFEFKKAIEYNAFFVFIIPYLLLGLLFETSKTFKLKFFKLQRILFGRVAIIILIFLMFLWVIIRNLIF